MGNWETVFPMHDFPLYRKNEQKNENDLNRESSRPVTNSKTIPVGFLPIFGGHINEQVRPI